MPETLIATVTVALTVAASLLASPWVTVPSCLVVVPLLWVSTLVPAPGPGRLPAQMAAWSRLTGGVAETVEGGRTVGAAAPGAPGPPHRRRHPRAVPGQALHPVPADGVVPGDRGRLPDPGGDRGAGRRPAPRPRAGHRRPGHRRRLCASWSTPSTWSCPGSTTSRSARPPSPAPARDRPRPGRPGGHRPPAGRRPAGRPRRPLRLRPAGTCSTGSTSTCAQERLAVVGPSGAGKSTLGRLLAGVNAPRAGR